MQNVVADVMVLCQMVEQDVKNFIQWVWALRHKNSFDMKVLTYPRAVMFRAQDDDGATLYIPAHPILMFESLAPKPGITKNKTALSMFRIGELAEQTMKDAGLCESYFITNDQPEVLACEKAGWTAVMHDPEKKTWLMKKSIEPPQVPVTPNEVKADA